MANKRKREDPSDSDSDEITPGKQILPVAKLPYNFDQEPQDGMQYLFLVRRDARRLPRVTRVYNPYEVSEKKVTPTLAPLSTNVLPREEWKIAFQTHFSNLRKNLTQATIHVDQDQPDSRGRVIPEKKDRDAWWKFLAGCPESAWHPRERSVRKKLNMTPRTRAFADPAGVVHSQDAALQSGTEPSHFQIACLDALPRNVPQQPSSLDRLQTVEPTNSMTFAADFSMSSEKVGEEQLSPPEVTPSHLREIDHRMSMHLLMYFTHWINVHLQNPSDPMTSISVSHGRWIFALLTKAEDQLSADEMNLLRNLARACLGLIQRYRGKHATDNAAPAGISDLTLMENATDMSEASCWMIFAAVAGHWGQRDLWADAETGLSSC
ncbi:survival motor neuron interacting protein 1-domain-containing protein [Boletus edulis]|nr:survival motor neuron interacting protein 1-domain-containing protein [Boletus edulis]